MRFAKVNPIVGLSDFSGNCVRNIGHSKNKAGSPQLRTSSLFD